jgi:hypothetical protein
MQFAAVDFTAGERNMRTMKRNKVVTGAILAIIATALIAFTQPVQGQEAKPEIIQMANLLANFEKTIDAKKAKAGDAFTAKTVTPATLNDGTAVPVGSVLEGHIDSATPSEHHSDSTMVLTIDKLHLKDGKDIKVKAILVSIASLEPAFGGDGKADDQHFDRPAGAAPSMPGSASENTSSTGSQIGPHAVPGLTVTSSVKDSYSGTLTQKRGNVHLTNENQIQVSMAVVPSGITLQ